MRPIRSASNVLLARRIGCGARSCASLFLMRIVYGALHGASHMHTAVAIIQRRDSSRGSCRGDVYVYVSLLFGTVIGIHLKTRHISASTVLLREKVLSPKKLKIKSSP